MPNKATEPENDKNQKGIFNSWTANEAKLLAITIIGTISANIFTVIAVALAIIIARWFQHSKPTTAGYVFLWVFWVFPLLFLFSLYSGWKSGRRYSKLAKWLSILTGAWALLIILVSVLAAVGLAAGVK